jgi:hypothetical protein
MMRTMERTTLIMKPDYWITGSKAFSRDECQVNVRMFHNDIERLRLTYDELQSTIAEWPSDSKKIW